MDFVATMPATSPTVVEYYDPMAGQMVGTRTQYRVLQRRPASLPRERAEASSTNKILEFKSMDAPEHIELRRLRRFKTFSSDWDAEGAAAPSHAAIDSAIVLLSLLSAHGALPKVVLTSDGLPMLFFPDTSFIGEVVVKPDGKIDYYFDTPDGDGEANVEFNGKSLPASLLDHIRA